MPHIIIIFNYEMEKIILFKEAETRNDEHL